MAGKITMGRGSQTTLKKSDRGSRTWHEEDDISSERKQLDFFYYYCSSKKPSFDFACVCISIRRRRAAALQHPASVGEVHHGAAGGAVLLPRLPASGPGHHHRQLVALQVRGAVQDHRRQQTLLPVPQVHSWLLTPSIWEQHLRSDKNKSPVFFTENSIFDFDLNFSLKLQKTME